MAEILMGREYLAFKSTIDRLAQDVRLDLQQATAVTDIEVAEIEDVSLIESVLKNSRAAVVYRLDSFTEHPRKPRFSGEFSIGLKTKGDALNLLMSSMVSSAAVRLAVETQVRVKDYLDPGTPDLGAFIVGYSTVSRQEFDKEQGLRFIRCKVLAVIRGS